MDPGPGCTFIHVHIPVCYLIIIQLQTRNNWQNGLRLPIQVGFLICTLPPGLGLPTPTAGDLRGGSTVLVILGASFDVDLPRPLLTTGTATQQIHWLKNGTNYKDFICMVQCTNSQLFPCIHLETSVCISKTTCTCISLPVVVKSSLLLTLKMWWSSSVLLYRTSGLHYLTGYKSHYKWRIISFLKEAALFSEKILFSLTSNVQLLNTYWDLVYLSHWLAHFERPPALNDRSWITWTSGVVAYKYVKKVPLINDRRNDS